MKRVPPTLSLTALTAIPATLSQRRVLAIMVLLALSIPASSASGSIGAAAAIGPVSHRESALLVSQWLMGGCFSGNDLCAVAVVARSSISSEYAVPSDGMTKLKHALETYERQRCPVGDVWMVKMGMTDREVASIVGAPRPALSGPHCWYYRATKPGTTVEGRRICFIAGRVTSLKAALHSGLPPTGR